MSQTTFRDRRVHFCAFFPTTFLEIAVLGALRDFRHFAFNVRFSLAGVSGVSRFTHEPRSSFPLHVPVSCPPAYRILALKESENKFYQ